MKKMKLARRTSPCVACGAPIVASQSADFSGVIPVQSITINDALRGNNNGVLDLGDLGSQMGRTVSSAQRQRLNEIRADLGWATLNTITAYQTFSRSEYNDWDGTPAAESDVYFYNEIKAFSQEARLSNQAGRLNWMVGAHYADESIDGGFYTEFRGANRNLINTPYDQSVEAIGVFTHNSFALTDRLSLIAGQGEPQSRTAQTSTTFTALTTFIACRRLTGSAAPPIPTKSDETSGIA